MAETITDDRRRRFWEKVERLGPDQCWSWRGTRGRGGYGRFWFQERTHAAHRVSWIFENGEFEPRLLVCHKCDNPSCVNPNHLFLGNQSENVVDMVRKGRRGALCGNRKLTESDVLEIRRVYALGGATHKELSSRYGVGPYAIGAITRNKTWRHLL